MVLRAVERHAVAALLVRACGSWQLWNRHGEKLSEFGEWRMELLSQQNCPRVESVGFSWSRATIVLVVNVVQLFRPPIHQQLSRRRVLEDGWL